MSSQLVTSILDPKPGDQIPMPVLRPEGNHPYGSKDGKPGGIYALDLSNAEIRFDEGLCERLGWDYKNGQGRCFQNFSCSSRNEIRSNLSRCPCSGFGTLRRNPDLKWRREEVDIQRMGELSSILRNLSSMWRRVASDLHTCTVSVRKKRVVRSF